MVHRTTKQMLLSQYDGDAKEQTSREGGASEYCDEDEDHKLLDLEREQTRIKPRIDDPKT
jgi:hypothetical protein